MSQRTPRRPLLVIAGVLSIFAFGAEYRGCSGGADRLPEEGLPLPEATGDTCVVNTDCGFDECSVLECVSGECVPAGPRTDADADGYSPMPCGTDCDDTAGGTFPGALELCDGINQDCDASIDEGASGIDLVSIDDAFDEADIVASGERFAVVGLFGGALTGYVVEPGGSSTSPQVLTGGGVELFDAASDGDRIVVAYRSGSGPPLRLDLRADASGVTAQGEPQAIDADASDVTAIAVHVVDGLAAFAYRATAGSAPRQRIFIEGRVAPIDLDVGETLGLSDDGSRIVTTAGTNDLWFFASDLSTAHLNIPGSFAAGPLAPGDGSVFVAYRDAFDHNLTTYASSGTSAAPSAAPFGPPDDQLSIFRVAEGVLVTRHNAGSVRAWVLAPDLRTYIATFVPMQLSEQPSGPSRVGAASTQGGQTVILSSYPGSSQLAFLGCGTR